MSKITNKYITQICSLISFNTERTHVMHAVINWVCQTISPRENGMRSGELYPRTEPFFTCSHLIYEGSWKMNTFLEQLTIYAMRRCHNLRFFKNILELYESSWKPTVLFLAGLLMLVNHIQYVTYLRCKC